MKRSMYCGQVRTADIGKELTMCGWVHSRRDHGGVIFIDLRDREGILQVVFQPEAKEIFAQAEKIRSEYVLSVKGSIRKRPQGTENPNMPTGEVELVCKELEIINTAPALPFEISEYTETSEDMRLKYRFLDLRRPNIQKNFILRHKIMQEVRQSLTKQGFIEVETPMLTKSTPEGARDFLVPSRLNPGHFYALPQSPQIFKQILMVSGFDKYFQVVRCFRDEDLRADRQLEFTQIDLELSFVEEDDVMKVIEGMLAEIFKNALNIEIKTPFIRMPYSEAMLRYGSDKPDTRFALEITDLTAELKDCGFKVFNQAAAKGGAIRGLCVKGGASFSRSEIDDMTSFVGTFGAKGLAWMKVTEAGPESNIVKFFSPEDLKKMQDKMGAKAGDILLFLADDESVVCAGLGALRIKLAKQLKLIPEKAFNFLWVVDFPLFAYNKEEKKWDAMHHPFTSPKAEHVAYFDDHANVGRMLARAYDVVLNGVELGGGSIRIHKEEVQEKLFKMINMPDAEAKEKFGYLLDALSYGAPPHGGIALGFDRLCALLMGEESIREVIAFPKTQKGVCPMSGAPGQVNDRQMKELHIRQVLPVQQAEQKPK